MAQVTTHWSVYLKGGNPVVKWPHIFFQARRNIHVAVRKGNTGCRGVAEAPAGVSLAGSPSERLNYASCLPFGSDPWKNKHISSRDRFPLKPTGENTNNNKSSHFSKWKLWFPARESQDPKSGHHMAHTPASPERP